MIKRVVFYLLFVTRVGHLCGALARYIRGPRVRVLYGHNVLPSNIEHKGVFDQLGFMDETEFKQMASLLKTHTTPLSLEAALKALKTGTLPARATVLTFDDGYKDKIDRILPVLEKFQIPAVMFLSSGFMDDAQTFWFNRLIECVCRSKTESFRFDGDGEVYPLTSDHERAQAINAVAAFVKTVSDQKKHALLSAIEKSLAYDPANHARLLPMLSWDDAKRLAANPLITIGAHTITHPILTQMSLKDAYHEIREGADEVARRTGVRPVHFAYPNGRADDYNVALRDFIQQSGFESASATEAGGNGRDTDLFALRREGFDREPLYRFGLRMVGFFDFVGLVRKGLKEPGLALKTIFYRLIPRSLLFRDLPGSRNVYLTFDDGPNPEFTPRVLDILKENDVKATFFLSGLEVERFPDLAKRIAAEGHALANHGWEHERWSHGNLLGLWADMARSESTIKRAGGKSPMLFRPAYGRLTLSLLFIAAFRRVRIALWSVNSDDFQKIPAETILRACSNAGAGDVLLFHDDNPGLIEALPELIRYFRRAELKLECLPA